MMVLRRPKWDWGYTPPDAPINSKGINVSVGGEGNLTETKAVIENIKVLADTEPTTFALKDHDMCNCHLNAGGVCMYGCNSTVFY